MLIRHIVKIAIVSAGHVMPALHLVFIVNTLSRSLFFVKRKGIVKNKPAVCKILAGFYKRQVLTAFDLFWYISALVNLRI